MGTPGQGGRDGGAERGRDRGTTEAEAAMGGDRGCKREGSNVKVERRPNGREIRAPSKV